MQSLTPACTHAGLGSSGFARRYFRNRCFFLFLRLLRCFSSPGSLCMAMYLPYSDWGLLSRVSPFRYLRIKGYLLLPEAFRSLSRLSSALSAKASTLRSYQLDQIDLKVTAWTRAGCFLIPRCIALHLWSGLFTKFVVLFSTWSITWSHGLGCLDIQLNNQSFLFNMRFSRYVSDWHFYQSSASSNLFKLTDHW